MGWKSSFNRKKYQRMVNKYVRKINHNVEKDDLWRGRFYMRQVGSPRFIIYEDKSGGDLENVHLIVVDRLTGNEVHGWDSANGWCYFNGSKIWQFMNDAIVEKFDVWHKDNNPRDLRDNPDYDFTNPKVRNKWKKEWKTNGNETEFLYF